MGFSLVAASRSYSGVVMCRLLTLVAYLVGEHWLQGSQASVVVAPRLKSTGSVFEVQGLVALWHFPETKDQTPVL